MHPIKAENTCDGDSRSEKPVFVRFFSCTACCAALWMSKSSGKRRDFALDGKKGWKLDHAISPKDIFWWGTVHKNKTVSIEANLGTPCVAMNMIPPATLWFETAVDRAGACAFPANFRTSFCCIHSALVPRLEQAVCLKLTWLLSTVANIKIDRFAYFFMIGFWMHEIYLQTVLGIRVKPSKGNQTRALKEVIDEIVKIVAVRQK